MTTTQLATAWNKIRSNTTQPPTVDYRELGLACKMHAGHMPLSIQSKRLVKKHIGKATGQILKSSYITSQISMERHYL